MNSNNGNIGYLPAIAVGTLAVFYVIWAALHDIVHGESDATLEYAALLVSVPAFALLYRAALSRLSPKAKVAWLRGAGLLLLLFSLGAAASLLRPKYALDPLVGSLFLAASVPVLGLMSYHLVREASHRRAHPR